MSAHTPTISDIEQAIQAIADGRPVIVADNEDRENEGDVILSAELASQEWVAWTVRWSSGLLCAPMSNDIADQLDLPMMVERNEDVRGTAYTVTVDASEGITTGISAHDRATTARALAQPNARPEDVRRPGHVLPLRAVDGGVRARNGHTEAAVELMRLAGLRPVSIIAEIVAEDGEMMRLPGLLELGEREGIPVITIEQLIHYLNERDPQAAVAGADALVDDSARLARESGRAGARRVSLRADAALPTTHGNVRAMAYRDRRLGVDHVALVAADPEGRKPGTGALVRVHSECITGEAFGSLKCECGPQLDAALDLIADQGGVVVYLRGQEGRGIGLANKLRAYQLQEQGIDTLDANLQLGLPADAREYGAAAEILEDLGISHIRLLTNNPAKISELEANGVSVAERVPLLVGVTNENIGYLSAKRDRMGHELPENVRASDTSPINEQETRA